MIFINPHIRNTKCSQITCPRRISSAWHRSPIGKPRCAFARRRCALAVLSRPEDGALRQGLALLVLEQPVAFHSTENDPVDLVWMFCATDHKAHLSMLAALAELLDNAATLAAIRAAKDAPAIAALAAPF